MRRRATASGVRALGCQGLTTDRESNAGLDDAEPGRAFFDAAPDTTVILGSDGSILDANPAATELTGYSLDELLTMKADQFFGKAELEANPLALSVSRGTGPETIASLRSLICKDGSVIPVDIRRTDLESGLILAVLRDATAILAQQKALVEAQAVTHVGSWEQDPSTGLLTCSEEFYRIFGLPPSSAETSLEVFTKYAHPDQDPDAFAEARKQARDDRKPLEVELRIRRPSGEARTINVRGHADLDADGRFSRIRGTIQDVTDLRAAETEAIENSARMKSMFDGATDAIFVRDPVGMIVDANPAATRMLGYSRDELLTLSVEDLTLKEDLEFARLLKRETDQGALTAERSLLRKDRSTVLVDLNFSPLPDGCVLGIARDIEARVRSEQKAAEAADELQKRLVAIEQLDDMIMITDIDANITYVNPAYERVSGYAREEVLGLNPRVLNSGQQGAEVYEQLWSAITSGDTWRGRLVDRRKDGSLFTADATISPVLSDAGELLGYVNITRDVTKQLELEEGLAEARRMESIGRLAGGIAHDFNNLLTVVMGSAEMIRAESSDDECAELSQEIITAARRGSELVRQLLAFSQRQTLGVGDFDVELAVSEASAMLSRIVGGSIALSTNVTDGLPDVLMDQSEFDQILANLVVNARDALPSGGNISIDVSDVYLANEESRGSWTLAPGHYLKLQVADNGDGMDAEVAERIFEPFFTTKQVGKGTGLGLATIHGIVSQSGGSIEVDSAPGIGTTFTVHLRAERKDQELLAD